MLQSGLFITAELRIKPDKELSHAISALNAYCHAMETEPGCSMALPLQDKEDPYRFILWERYNDNTAFEAHFQAQHTQDFMASEIADLVQAFELQHSELEKLV
ncbi:antibiotic biosynthesis monooxygenase [Marinomonas sp. 15G1-11]|uniref:Antibiotic biosynthesis monooxygenase n=1 Tax=Marinomonas phaeophyticola TaxID=3004091 RepID=A0ABT4JZA9_9GAMM|nr:antibiotic biosynthesis monooxygenase family protein [Marinomonas sp. 15G1-11]MCZ2723730.1 antibiotic biosynthesis monooxygenase [Marinomonas sp. 15G1-11]